MKSTVRAPNPNRVLESVRLSTCPETSPKGRPSLLAARGGITGHLARSRDRESCFHGFGDVLHRRCTRGSPSSDGRDDCATAACVCSARKLVFVFVAMGEDPGRYFTYFGARGFISVAIVARTCQVHRPRSHDERADGNIEQVQGAARSR